MPIFRLDQLQQFAAVKLSLDPGDLGGPVIVPQCAQITLNWNLSGGKTGHNVMYGRYAGAFAGTQAQANSIHTALSSGAAWTAMAAQIAPAQAFAGVSIRDVNTAGAAIVTSNTAAAPGTSAQGELPNEVAICVTLRTALTGPRNRGRIYLPGWANGTVQPGNIIGAAVVTAVNNWAATLSTAFSAQGYTFVLGQKARGAYIGSTGTAHPALPASSQQITSAICRDNHFDTQRRRGLK